MPAARPFESRKFGNFGSAGHVRARFRHSSTAVKMVLRVAFGLALNSLPTVIGFSARMEG